MRTPERPRPLSHKWKFRRHSEDSVNLSAAPMTSRYSPSFTPMAAMTATFSKEPPQARLRQMLSMNT